MEQQEFELSTEIMNFCLHVLNGPGQWTPNHFWHLLKAHIDLWPSVPCLYPGVEVSWATRGITVLLTGSAKQHHPGLVPGATPCSLAVPARACQRGFTLTHTCGAEGTVGPTIALL